MVIVIGSILSTIFFSMMALNHALSHKHNASKTIKIKVKNKDTNFMGNLLTVYYSPITQNTQSIMQGSHTQILSYNLLCPLRISHVFIIQRLG